MLEVRKEYPLIPFCNHLQCGSRKTIKRYGLSVTHCMVLLCMGNGCVLPKCPSVNVVVDCE